MTDTEKIINKTKQYILSLYLEGYSTHQNMISGLKNGIDFFVGLKTCDIEKLKHEIIATCLQEFDKVTKVYDKEGHIKKIEKLRIEFENFVTNLNHNEIDLNEPIAFERRLKKEENELLIKTLKNKYDFDSWSNKSDNYYWEPLAQTDNIQPFIYFDDKIFNEKEIDILVQIIMLISGERVFFLTEGLINYEVETSILDFDWIESAYCDFETNWLIYISHEGTVTFCGEQLLNEIEIRLPDLMRFKNPWE